MSMLMTIVVAEMIDFQIQSPLWDDYDDFDVVAGLVFLGQGPH